MWEVIAGQRYPERGCRNGGYPTHRMQIPPSDRRCYLREPSIHGQADWTAINSVC
jgi:hypothetical protein